MQDKQIEHEKVNTLIFENVKHSPAIFTQEEIDVIFKTLKESKDYPKKQYGEWERTRDLTILAFLTYGGFRPKEVCYLNFSDIDFQKKIIFISGNNNHVKKDRTIPLPKKVMPYLESYLSFPKRYWKNRNYVFPSIQGNKLNPNTWKSIFREKVLKACGLWEKPEKNSVPRYRSYTLRHTRATQILDETKDLYACSNLLGHHDIRSTTTYLHLTKKYQEYLRKIIDDEVEVLKTPNVQINQTTNINILIQQLNLLMQQQQKQNELIIKLLKHREN